MSQASGRTVLTIPASLRTAVAEHSERLVFCDGRRALTYQEFDAATNAIAQRLLGLGEGRPLVVVAPLDVSTVEVLHGAVKAGRLTVPLDPRWPREQWLAVARATEGRLVVPDEATRAMLPAPIARDSLVAPELHGGDAEDPHLELDPEAPAFVFFTSGSTGAPKGTVLTHAFVETALGLMRMRPGDRYAMVSSLSFITGALAAFGVPLTGASAHVKDVTNTDPIRIARWLRAEGITMLGLTPTVVGLFARAALDDAGPIESIRLVVHGGEVGSPEHFALAHRAFPNAVLVNAYGMTESGGAGCQYEVDPDAVATGEALPVGRPLPGVRIDIVDDVGRPVPDGEPGEIRISARRVALGYWNQPTLDAERFSIGPDGLRAVRTGDRGRLRADGMVEHLGRADRRVKVHGQLVDLAEVEQELTRLPEVRKAVVSSVLADDGKPRVVAHVVLEDGRATTVGALRRALGDRLPPYAIPRAFLRVEDVPTAITGKVDRTWLRESVVGALPLDTAYVAPRNERERAVAALFEEVLALERVGACDDFFELGGDSLSAIELLAGLAEELDLDLTPSELLDGARVEQLAVRIGGDRSRRDRRVVPVNHAAGPHLFCIPGAADTPLQYRQFGRRLPGVAVWSFTYRGIDARAVPDLSVAAIARRNVAAMRGVDPTGPYRLLGYSFGGAVALEMAQQLTRDDAEVELLALLEPTIGSAAAPAPGPGHFERVRGRSVASAPGGDARARLTRLRMMGGAAVRHVQRQAKVCTAGLVVRRGLEQHEVFMRLHTWVMGTFRPEPYHGRAILLGSDGYFDAVGDELDRLLPPESAGGRRTDIVVPGAHVDLVREPGVAAVAHAIDLVLTLGAT